MKQIVCMKWGTLYGSEYVNRLYAMARAQTSGELRFVCLTDDRTGVRPEVECLDCPTIDIPFPYNLLGWRKVNLFAQSDKLFGFTGNWLFIDLDVVITGNLDDFFVYKPERPFVVMQNWTQPGQKIGNTSVYRFTVGAASFLLPRLIQNFAEIKAKYNNSQTFISREIGDIEFWPDEWCQLFKVQCIAPFPQRLWRDPIIPTGCRIVAFPGSPNPHEAAKGQWPERKAYKRLYKRIRPARWIEAIWAASEKSAASK